MLRYILLLALASTSCAVPTYATRHGIKVYDKTVINTPTQQEVERVTEYILNHLPSTQTLQPTYIKSVKLVLVNKWIEIPDFKGNGYTLADGLTNPFDRSSLISVFHTCFADSSFAHELMHLIHTYSIPDWWHEDVKLWALVKELESDMIKDLCPEDYVHKDISKDYVPPK